MKNSSKSYSTMLVIALLLASLLLAACQTAAPATAEPTAAPTSAPVQPTERISIPVEDLFDLPWILVGYGDPANPTVLPRNTLVTAVFAEDGSLAGSSACNRYATTFEADDTGKLSIRPEIATTRMACAENLMAVEQAFLQALTTVQAFSFSAAGDLQISYQDAQGNPANLVFVVGQAPLTGTTWVLTGYGQPGSPQSPQAGTIITANFGEDGILGGSAGCNTFATTFTTEDGQLTLQPLASTQMFCETGMEQEQAFLELLSSAAQYELAGKNLVITAQDGQVLNFSSRVLPLETTLWSLVTLDGQALPADTKGTLALQPDPAGGANQAGGLAGCNSYVAGYSLEGESIIFSEIASTLMMCEDDLMQFETRFLEILAANPSFEIIGDHLMLISETGTATFIADRTPLTGAHWVLRALGDKENPQPPVAGSRFTAVFTASPNAPTGVMAGTTGCNEYAAAYTAGLDRIKINLPQSTNNRTCVPGLIDQEQIYFLALNDAAGYQITGNTLQIPYDEGKQVLIFDGVQLAQGERRPLADLDATRWYLWTINDQPVANGTTVTADFSVNADGESGTIGGSAGCNRYQAAFGNNLGVETSLSSNQLCSQPPGVQAQETTYLQALQRAYGYWLTGDQLILNTGNGALTYRRTQPPQSSDQAHLLQANAWFLVSHNTTHSTPSSEGDANLRFNADGSFNGYTGCNQIQGRYTTNIAQISFSEITSTKAACTNALLTTQEQAILDVLNSAQSYQVFETNLNLVGARGVLNFYFAPVNRPGDVQPPVAVIQAPAQARTGEIVRFDASRSTGQVPLVSFRWDFGDGGRGSSAVVDHVYRNPGTYNVQMTVTDARGYNKSAAVNIVINAREQPTPQPTQPPAPTAQPTQPPAPTPEPTQPSQPTPEPTQPAEPTPEPTEPPAPTAEPTEPPAPEQLPPQAAISGPASGFPGEPITFDARGSTAGSSPITAFHWDFGDGTTADTGATATTAKIFNRSGAYEVTVIVTDQNGLSSSATTPVVIRPRLDTEVWMLRDLVNRPLVSGTAITAQFLNGAIAGFAGCNSYSGSYTAEENPDGGYTIAISGLTSTQAACPDAIMRQELLFLAQLATVQAARFDQLNSMSLAYPEGVGPNQEVYPAGELFFFDLDRPAAR